MTAGDIDIQSEVGNTTITNCMFAKNGIRLVGDNSNTKINNCLLFGLTIGSNKRTIIRNTTIVDNKIEKNKDRQFAVKGFISGEINNCVIFGDANYALSFRSGAKESTNYKNCLLYGGNSVAYHTDSQERISTEKEFKKGVGRVTNVIFDRPEFSNPIKGDYRLKEFTPGYQQGEEKKSMGIQMDAALNFLNVD